MTTIDNIDEIIRSNLEYLPLILYEIRINGDSMIVDFLCKYQDNRNEALRSKSLISMTDSNIRWNYQSYRSMTPLHVAATLDLVEPKALLDLAITYGGDISATEVFGQHILHTACSWKNSHFVEAVISRRSSLKVSKDVVGWTPLRIAIKATRYC